MAMKLPLVEQIRAAGLPPPNMEYEFCPDRKWRLDFCWPAHGRLAVEIDGGVYTQGRHTRGKGYEEDCRKHAAALLLGYRVLRVTTGMVESGEALRLINEALRQGD